MRATRLLIIAVLVGMLPAVATAQTRPETCAADSLFLVSPSSVILHLQNEMLDDRRLVKRAGMVITWEDLFLEEATCFSLRGLDDIDLDVVAAGGFGDRVDRQFRFTSLGSGSVGAEQSESLSLSWRNDGPSTYGDLAGIINLADNGGFWRWDESTPAWDRFNSGLPMSWRQVNVRALALNTDGVMYAGFSSGQTFDNLPRGVYRYNGTTWTRLLNEVADSDMPLVTRIAVSDLDSDHVAVGTDRDGLWISTDGGVDFTQWSVELDPLLDPQPTTFKVSAVDWTGSRILVAVRGLGSFRSLDNGVSFERMDNLVVPNDLDVPPGSRTLIEAIVTEFTVDRSDPDRILASLSFHGCYESNDGGDTWHDLYGDLVVPDPDEDGLWSHTALSTAIDPTDPQVLVMGVEQRGIYVTTDGGVTWTLKGQEPGLQPDNPGVLRNIKVRALEGVPGRILAMEDSWSLLVSEDSGQTWDHFADQPLLNTARVLETAGGGDFVVGTWSGGVYQEGSAIVLSDTYSSETSSELRSLELGLDLTFVAGNLVDGDSFELVGQTFQGWAVWRATADDPDGMTLIGLYDRVNPESCIAGYCGAPSFDPIPQCFASKRAACFEFFTTETAVGPADSISFFDEEVFNGFNYLYAVSSFDYGNTALATPENNSNTMLFSPRWDGDPASPFNSPTNLGNRQPIQVNLAEAAEVGGQEIYVFPNPLRNDAGIPGEEGRTVVFTNLPPRSRVRIFTTAGDDVANLPPESQVGGQIRWGTVNRKDEPVAPGVYLYKVEIEQQEDYWGRLVIIR